MTRLSSIVMTPEHERPELSSHAVQAAIRGYDESKARREQLRALVHLVRVKEAFRDGERTAVGTIP